MSTKDDTPDDKGQNKNVPFASKNLNTLVDEEFDTRSNAIARSLLKEAQKIDRFLDSDEIPWGLVSIDKENSTGLLSKIEEVSSEFWLAIGKLVMLDKAGEYEDLVIEAVSSIARHREAPSGALRSQEAVYIRYLPLFVALKIILIFGVAKRSASLLNKIFKIEVKNESGSYAEYSVCKAIDNIRSAHQIFQEVELEYPGDAVASYIRGLINQMFNMDELLRDTDERYYPGEFVLCISPLDQTGLEIKRPIYRNPSSGLYMYFPEAIPIITRFLKTEKEFLSGIFTRPLEEILSDFDATAQKFNYRFPADGFIGGALKAAGFSNEN